MVLQMHHFLLRSNLLKITRYSSASTAILSQSTHGFYSSLNECKPEGEARIYVTRAKIHEARDDVRETVLTCGSEFQKSYSFQYECCQIIDNRCGDDDAVEAVHDSAVPRYDLAVVLDLIISLDGRCGKVSEHGNDCTDACRK